MNKTLENILHSSAAYTTAAVTGALAGTGAFISSMYLGHMMDIESAYGIMVPSTVLGLSFLVAGAKGGYELVKGKSSVIENKPLYYTSNALVGAVNGAVSSVGGAALSIYALVATGMIRVKEMSHYSKPGADEIMYTSAIAAAILGAAAGYKLGTSWFRKKEKVKALNP